MTRLHRNALVGKTEAIGQLVSTGNRQRFGARFKYEFVCSCGAAFWADVTKVRTGHTQSCGCYQRKMASEAVRTHGETSRDKKRSPEYRAWVNMWTRCSNKKYVLFKRYGGRGIAVCNRWKSFEAFLEDMGRRPSPVHSLDRCDNDKNYEPSNCRWATRQEQSRNRSCAKLTKEDVSKIIGMRRSHTQQQIADILGVDRSMISRIDRGLAWRDVTGGPLGCRDE